VHQVFLHLPCRCAEGPDAVAAAACRVSMGFLP
jgi:hypothetical protein